MASHANRVTLLRILSTRRYAAEACPQSSKSGKGALQVATLPNGIVVATAESNSPTSRVSIVFRAGSRHESYDNLGASHLLRISAGLTTRCSSAFAITRNIQQIGGRLTSTSDRELVSFTVEATSDNLETGICFLQDVATGPTFKPWEISDSIPRIKAELAAVPDEVRVVELLHKAAFRRQLGNSIFCPEHQIGKLSTETLLQYFNENCRTNRCAVVGVGVDHDFLTGYAQNLPLESGKGEDIESKYYGEGEIRYDKGGDVAHVAIAGEGGALNNTKETLAFGILQYAAGVRPPAKRGTVNGVIGKGVSSALAETRFSFSTLNASYADSGLFGFVLSTDARNVGKGISAALKGLRSGAVSGEDVKRGKALLKAAVFNEMARDSGLLQEIGSQAALLKKVHDAEQIAAAIDGVSNNDVVQAAKKVAGSKLSMAAVGNLACVPHVSEL